MASSKKYKNKTELFFLNIIVYFNNRQKNNCTSIMMKRDTKYWARMERRIEKNDYLQSLQGGPG